MSFEEVTDLLLLMNSYYAERETQDIDEPTQEERELQARIEKAIPRLAVMWIEEYETYSLVPRQIADQVRRSTPHAV